MESSTSIAFQYQTLLPSTRSLSPSLGPIVLDFAISSFFSNHVVDLGVSSRNFIDQLQASSSPNAEQGLVTSIKAVGLAQVSNAMGAPEIMNQAIKHYVAAVRLINAALQSPVIATKDITLLTVMILSLFETLSAPSEVSIDSWVNHLNGAASLLKVRGPEQLASPSGRRLYGYITTDLATSCMQRGVELPQHVLDLRLELNQYVNTSHIVWRTHEHMLHMTNLSARVQNGRLQCPQDIIDSALAIDLNIIETFSDVATDLTFTTTYTASQSNSVYGGYYHIYHNSLAALIWNSMRTHRMMLHQIIRRALLDGFSRKPPSFVTREYTEQLQTSTDILSDMSFGIIASVPQHLGYVVGDDDRPSPKDRFAGSEPMLPRQLRHSTLNTNTLLPKPSSELKAESLPWLRMAGGHQLPWALYLVGYTDVCSEPVLRWVIRMLKHISQTMGVQQSAILAARLERDRLPLFANNDCDPE